MSRKQPVFTIGLLFFSCLVIGFLLVFHQRDHTALAQNTAPPLAGQNPYALIKTIVVRGAEVEKVGPSDVAVQRLGNTSGAEPGMMLYVGDHVTTGAGVRLTILFLDNAAERDNEVVLDASTHVQIGSLFAWAGKVLARVKDKFQTKTTRAQWSVVGTEYELVVQPDGTNVLRVLKGAVQGDTGIFTPTTSAAPEINPNAVGMSHHSSFRETALQSQSPMTFVAVSGKVTDVDREFILTNTCRERHVYRVVAPLNLPWFQFMGADQFAIDGNGTRSIKFAIRLDATRVPAGTIESQIAFPCNDCNTEPGCRIGGFLLPITMNVISSPDHTVVPASPTPTPPVSILATRMQEAILPVVGELRKADVSPQQVQQTLNWSNGVIVPGEPTYSAQSIIPHYPNWSERDRVFRQARLSSIINDDRRSKQMLANVYIDWGNGAKAEEELKNVEVTTQELPGQWTTLGEARRLMGDLAKAEELLKRAINFEPTWTPAYNALGNVYLDHARAQQDLKNYEAARSFLEKAQAEFAKVLQLKAQSAPTRQNHAQAASQTLPTGSKIEAVAHSNIGEVHLRLGEIARVTSDGTTAIKELEIAEQSFALAVRTDQSYQFGFAGLGDVYREIGNTHRQQGNGAQADQFYRRAESQFGQALRLHNDMAEAYVGLGRVFDATGREAEARNQYHKATQVRPELPEPHYYLAVALADVAPARAAEQARAYLKLERAPFKQGRKAQDARDVSDGRPIQRPTLAPRFTPTPPRDVIPPVTPTPPREDVPPITPITPPVTPITPPVMVKIPPMKGDRTDRAVAELRGKGLIGVLRNQRDCEATGRVLGTQPKSGESVPSGSEVIILVSSAGENPVTMPTLKGVSQTDAEDQLRSLDLRPEIKKRENERAKPYTVMSQDPDGGKQLPAGCKVELTVAIPIPPVVVGNFVGRNMQEIYSLLNGLSVGTVTEVDSQQSGGTILAQSLKPGEVVPRGTSINLQVSADLVYVPDVMNLSREQAEAKLKNAGLQAEYQGKPVPEAFVTSQDPVAGKRVRRGSRVRLTFQVIG
ncbi:MAG TPA: PASTA domain-containing protein [Pyrinomonadaceae bacterium]|nr:PASTA domain-containing protein [Pyrinomonadaceae bacterium]